MVEFITYKKKKYPIRVSYYALKMIKAETGRDFQQANQDLDIYEDLLFYGLQQGAKVTGKEMPFKKEEMVDVLDECFFEFVGLLPKFFPNLTPAEVGSLGEGKKK